MSRFVGCMDGVTVNLDHVAYLQEHHQSDGRTLTQFVGADGGVIGATFRDMDIEASNGIVVPATAGASAFVVDTYNSEIYKGRPDSIQLEERYIIAWTVDLDEVKGGYSMAWPVFTGEYVLADTTVVYRMPDGSFRAPEQGTYRSLDEAKECLLEDAQRIWDIRNS